MGIGLLTTLGSGLSRIVTIPKFARTGYDLAVLDITSKVPRLAILYPDVRDALPKF